MKTFRRHLGAAAILIAVAAVAGCSAIPADPDGTLARVRGGVLTVGVTENSDRVATADGDQATGIEPDLVQEFADTLDAEVVFVEASEAELVEQLGSGDIDLAIGGFLDDTPWAEDAGASLPYAETTDDTGATQRHVMLVPLGENAFLLALDRFLTEQDAS